MKREVPPRYFAWVRWGDYFIYDPNNGGLIWKPRSPHEFKSVHVYRIWRTRFMNKTAGSFGTRRGGQRAYPSVCVGGIYYLVHRIVWEMHYGPIPDGMMIDHINRDPWDNRLSNLRLATGSQNQSNSKMPITNKSGIKGVSYAPNAKRWRAQIKVDKKRIHLGYFDRKEDAGAAYEAAAQKHLKQFYRPK